MLILNRIRLIVFMEIWMGVILGQGLEEVHRIKHQRRIHVIKIITFSLLVPKR